MLYPACIVPPGLGFCPQWDLHKRTISCRFHLGLEPHHFLWTYLWEFKLQGCTEDEY